MEKTYCIYNGRQFDLARDMSGQYLIITENSDVIDNTFVDKYGTGVYSKVVAISDLEEAYKICTYGVIDNQNVDIVSENENAVKIWTGDCEIAKKLQLGRTDKNGYEGIVNKESIKIIQKKETLFP